MDEELPSSSTISQKLAMKIYKDMYDIRRMEVLASDLYMKKIIRGFLHLYAGQEACAVGQKHAMEEVITKNNINTQAHNINA